MRALGNGLGVSAMALYGYISSRESLLNEVVERFLKTVDTRALRGERWEDTLIRTALSLRRAFVSSPHFAELMCDASGPASNPTCSSCALSILAKECQKISPCSSSPPPTRTLRVSHCAHAKICASSKPKWRANRQRPMRRALPQHRASPACLTGKANPAAEQPRFNERWRQTVAEDYSETSFQKGLLVIIEGIPLAWQDSPQTTFTLANAAITC